MERDLHTNLKPFLLNNTPFVYAHLIKFERPSLLFNMSKTKASTNTNTNANTHTNAITNTNIDINIMKY